MLLIFDEVVTGFRVRRAARRWRSASRPTCRASPRSSPAGCRAACVAGRKDILDLLDFDASARAGREKIAHPGTFNANPVSAAAGTAALTVIAETDAADRASATAADLRAKLNEVLAEAKVKWAVYGTYSGFHLFVNPSGTSMSGRTTSIRRRSPSRT